MSYDVAEYSDWEYEKFVYGNGRDPAVEDMDAKYGKGEWTNYDSSERAENERG